MTLALLATADPELVLRQAGDLLAGDPVGHNVVATKLADAIRYGEPGRYWLALPDGVPAGLAVQQPETTALAVAPMPADLVAVVLDAVAVDDGADGTADGTALPGVAGPAGTAARFAEMWAGLRAVSAVLTSQEQVWEVRDVRMPRGVHGTLRRAGEADLELLLSWLPGFRPGDEWARTAPAAVFVARRLAAGDAWIWDDNGPVSMACRTETVAGMSRIQAVNTPPALRGRGYASAGVAALSASVLAEGLRCVLAVNVQNVVASSVYQRLGYRAVSDMHRYRFGQP